MLPKVPEVNFVLYHVQDICGGTVKQSKEWFPKKETDFQCFPKCQK